jgi:hypothetical protein
MKSNWILAGLCTISLAGIGCENMRGEKKENEVVVNIDQVPEVVRDTFQREAKEAKITAIEKEMEKGAIVYETNVMIDGKNYEIEVAEDGTLLSKQLENEEDDD